MERCVLSTGLALQRNDSTIPFPTAAKGSDLERVRVKIGTCLSGHEAAGEWETYPLDGLSPAVRALLVERGLMTPDFSRLSGEARMLAVLRSGEASLEVNGGDHLRILGSRVGEKLPELWALLDSLDDYLEGEMPWAFDDTHGYLTANPASAGTGLRAYVTLLVPALMVSGRLGPTAMSLASLGLGIVPVWQASGGIFQVFNTTTAGTNEAGILERISEATWQMADRELTARKVLFRENPSRVRDYVGRALGVAQQAWSVTAEEAMSLVSAIHVGAELDVLEPRLAAADAFALVRRVQPGNLVINETRTAHAGLDDPGIDELRAGILREAFAETRAVA